MERIATKPFKKMSLRKHLASGDSLETATQKELRKLGVEIDAAENHIPETDTFRTALKEGFLQIGDNAQMVRVAKAFLELHHGDPYEEELGKVLRAWLNP